jgi:hypothetical protein
MPTYRVTIEKTETGLQPADDGWWILNARYIGWFAVEGGGTWCSFEAPGTPSPLLGIGIHVLPPGEQTLHQLLSLGRVERAIGEDHDPALMDEADRALQELFLQVGELGDREVGKEALRPDAVEAEDQDASLRGLFLHHLRRLALRGERGDAGRRARQQEPAEYRHETGQLRSERPGARQAELGQAAIPGGGVVHPPPAARHPPPAVRPPLEPELGGKHLEEGEASDALQVPFPDRDEAQVSIGAAGDVLAGQDLAWACLRADPRGDVHRSPE